MPFFRAEKPRALVRLGWDPLGHLVDDEGEPWRFWVAHRGSVCYCKVTVGSWNRTVWESQGPDVSFWRMAKQERSDVAMGVLRRLASIKKGSSGSNGCSDRSAEKAFPNICELLCSTVDEDGHGRNPSTITVCYQDGFWKAGLNEKDHAMTCWVSAATLEALFATLEAKLGSDEAEWRPWREAGSGPARRRGK